MRRPHAGSPAFADAAPRNPLPILLIIVGPTMLIGALLPLAIRMMLPGGRGEATREASILYTLNTVGGLLGAGLVNHYLVPAIGTQFDPARAHGRLPGRGSGRAAGPGAPAARGRFLAGGGTVAAAVVLGLILPDMMPALRRAASPHSTRADRAEVRWCVEGRAATVTVLDQFDAARGTYRDMYLNGVEEASTRLLARPALQAAGHPARARARVGEQPKEALVIAFGAGITAGSVLASDEVGSLDVVDLNPDIEGINDLFTEVNGDVFHQPRFHFHNDDGRNYLVTSGKQYDVIVNDSTHPRAYDSWILYTRGVLRVGAARLKPGGVFAQWVPVLGSMRGELMRIHLNTFRTVFPNATFWYVYGSDQAFLMSTPEPFALDAVGLQAEAGRAARPGSWPTSTTSTRWPRSPASSGSTAPAMDRMIAGETRLNTDDVHYFDKQSAVWPLPPQFHLPTFQASLVPYLRNADPALQAEVRQEQAVALAVGRYAFYGSAPDLHRAYCAAPDNGNVRYFMSLAFAGQLPEHDAFCQDAAERTYRDMVARHPDDPGALNALADALSKQGKLDEALTYAERAASLDPDNGAILDTKGWILSRQGHHAAALAVLEAANQALGGHPIVLYHLGATRLAAGDETSGRRDLERALEMSPTFDGHAKARELLAGLN